MSYNTKYNLKYPSGEDFYNVEDFNDNFSKISDEISNEETDRKNDILKLQNNIDGKAAENHKHSVNDITSGILPVTKGGTGKSSLLAGQVLVGNGADAVTTRAITATPASSSTSLITSGGVYNALNGKADASHTHELINLTGHEIRLVNSSVYSEGYFYFTNWRYTGYNRFVLGFTKNDNTNIPLIEYISTNGYLNSFVDLAIQGRTYTPTLELYAEKNGQNNSQANNGGHIDFHYNQKVNTNQTAGTENDYTARIIEDAPGELNVQANSSYTAKLKVAGKQVYTDDRIKAQSTDIAEGSTLENGNIILVYEN